jgi:hypothetical protein
MRATKPKPVGMWMSSLTRLSDRDFGFLPFMDAYQTIQKAFGEGVEVGYSTRSGLSPHIVGDVAREAVRIF